MPGVIFRTHFTLRNAGNAPADVRFATYKTLFSVRGFHSFFRISPPNAGLVKVLGPGQSLSVTTWTVAPQYSYPPYRANAKVEIFADPLRQVAESNEGNNYAIVGKGVQPGNLPWCPGYRPRVYGIVFKDMNRNGRRDAGEPGLQGVIVQLWPGGRKIGQATSGNTGAWSVSASQSGRYSITAIVPRSVQQALGGGISWTTPSHYYNVPISGGAVGPYRFGLAAMPPPPPAVKPIEPAPEASIGWGTAVTRPVVVGQDPDRRGADVFVTIRVRPAVYTWYEFDPNTGRWVRRQAAVTDYVDVNSIRLTARLTNQSRAWIRNTLAREYPGARVRRPWWNLRSQPTFQIVRNDVLPDGTNEVVIAVTRIPFEDPGVYTVHVSARTQGTSWPGSTVTDPQYLVRPAATTTDAKHVTATAPLKVWLLDTRLAY